MASIQNISIIGTGNVSWHLGHALKNAGFMIVEIAGRTQTNVESYAKALGAKPVLNLADLDNTVDLVLICITDDQIAEVETAIPAFKGIIAHTSGAKRINISRSNCGVFYPLQTFSKGIDVDFKQVPILVEGQTDNMVSALHELAGKLSNSVFNVSSDQREKLHVAAVFANNFSNHMFAQAYEICKTNNIPFSVLEALILETAKKAVQTNPLEAQTGPAVRQDEHTIEKHLNSLSDGNQRTLYKSITDSIIKQHETKL